jgi:hypothetical protein
MFAHIRSNPGANHRFITTTVATNMRDHVRNQRPILSGLKPSDPTMADMLAEIYMREFACAIKTLQTVNCVAGRYHEHAFDNTDAYIEDQDQGQGQVPVQTHEMNAEQRHAAQLLLGVGNSFSEINVTLRMIDASFQSATECSQELRAKLSQHFRVGTPFAEDAFDRLHHIVKQVWSLVNMLAFSNLFRFADHAMVLPTPDDSIFIPYVPTHAIEASHEEEDEEKEEE